MKSGSKHKEFKLEKEDIQGLVSRGYKSLNAAKYIFLKLDENGSEAKEYFNALVDMGLITTADTKGEKFTNSKDPTTAVHIAFTSSGLSKLINNEDIIKTFSREFIEGMCHTWKTNENTTIKERSTLLGDTLNNAPENWEWGNKNEVDCVLMFYAECNKELDMLVKDVYYNLKKGIKHDYVKNTFEYDSKISKEHFGFMDGIAQPFIKGMSEYEYEEDEDNLINPGEFILGYKNEYNLYSPSPYVKADKFSSQLSYSPLFKDKKDLGKNGCYLVFRQMQQHVERFWEFHYERSKEVGASQTERAVKLASKMIGRWPNGQPLVTCSNGGCPMDKEALDKFAYQKMDKDGVRCPLGAHIRRANPRDQIHTISHCDKAIEMVKKHRMLRRGRIYGEPVDKRFDVDTIIAEVRRKKSPDEKDEKTLARRGLHFICLVSDIARQFEFVQNVWANTSTFGNLCNEVDPIISPRPTDDQPDCHEFTTPQDIVRNRYTDVPEFTTVVGGAYFFMPGIKALKYIARS